MVVARIVVVVRAIIVECGQRCDGGDSYSGPVMSHISKQKKRKKEKKKKETQVQLLVPVWGLVM